MIVETNHLYLFKHIFPPKNLFFDKNIALKVQKSNYIIVFSGRIAEFLDSVQLNNR